MSAFYLEKQKSFIPNSSFFSQQMPYCLATLLVYMALGRWTKSFGKLCSVRLSTCLHYLEKTVYSAKQLCTKLEFFFLRKPYFSGLENNSAEAIQTKICRSFLWLICSVFTTLTRFFAFSTNHYKRGFFL